MKKTSSVPYSQPQSQSGPSSASIFSQSPPAQSRHLGDQQSLEADSLPQGAPSTTDSGSSSDDEQSLNDSSKVYHPSNVINGYLLDCVSDAMVAVTHDDEWASVLNEADDEIPENQELISRILNKFNIEITSEGACLQDRSADALGTSFGQETPQNNTQNDLLLKTIFESLEREFCPPLDSSLITALLVDVNVDNGDTETQLTALRSTLIELAARADESQGLDDDESLFDDTSSTGSFSDFFANTTINSTTTIASDYIQNDGFLQPPFKSPAWNSFTPYGKKKQFIPSQTSRPHPSAPCHPRSPT
ncbi:hypothetical protein FB451DRAFT_697810 [Mycena latifolia]|nr:hypothetical protein FB451DRAFT_697810 [Mycena latifolia]